MSKTVILIGLIVFGFTVSTGCGPKIPPELRPLYNLDSLVSSIGLLQDAVIGAESNKVITTNDARVIVTFCNNSLKTIKDGTQFGWKVSIINELDRIKPNLNNRFNTLITVIESILKELK